MKGWLGAVLVAMLLLPLAPAASSGSAALQIGVTVQRSCAVTRVPAAATIRVDCTRSHAPAPVVQIEAAPRVTRSLRVESSDVRRIEILF
jgi:hypothetical protein